MRKNARRRSKKREQFISILGRKILRGTDVAVYVVTQDRRVFYVGRFIANNTNPSVQIWGNP